MQQRTDEAPDATHEAAPSTGAAPHVDTEERANRAFSTSVLISGVRCLLAYVVFPWLLPAVGLASGVGPGIGLVVGVVAIGFNVASIRRFHVSDHRWKWQITALNSAVIVLLLVLLGLDVAALAD